MDRSKKNDKHALKHEQCLFVFRFIWYVEMMDGIKWFLFCSVNTYEIYYGVFSYAFF